MDVTLRPASAAIPRARWHCISCVSVCADLSEKHNICVKVADTIIHLDQTLSCQDSVRVSF